MALSDPGNTVFIKRCEDYDRKRIEAIVSEGMARFNYRPRGRVMVKPNVPYLQAAVERGYGPSRIDQITLAGDLQSVADLDEQARRLLPYDDTYTRWQDVGRELERLKSPMRLYWGSYHAGNGHKCLTGCVMGLKMFLGGIERFAGAEAFAGARPVTFVIGRCEDTIDARGEDVFLLGSCARADITNARKVTHLDKCFTTAGDMNLAIGHKLGMSAVNRDPTFLYT